MKVDNGAPVSATIVGVTCLKFQLFLLLNEYLYILGLSRNLISVSKLHEQLFAIWFANNSIVISKNSLDICHICLKNGLYFLRHAY